ncbi:hypothetical protein ABK040_007781 [Willaertia magna]
MLLDIFSSPTRIVYCPVYPKCANTLIPQLKQPFIHSSSNECLFDVTYDSFEFSSLLLQELKSNNLTRNQGATYISEDKIKKANGLILHFGGKSNLEMHCKEFMKCLTETLPKKHIPILILIDVDNKINDSECSDEHLQQLRSLVLKNLKIYFKEREKMFHFVEVTDKTKYYEPLEWLFEKVTTDNKNYYFL